MDDGADRDVVYALLKETDKNIISSEELGGEQRDAADVSQAISPLHLQHSEYEEMRNKLSFEHRF